MLVFVSALCVFSRRKETVMRAINDVKKQLQLIVFGACVCVSLKGIKLLPRLYSAYFQLARGLVFGLVSASANPPHLPSVSQWRVHFSCGWSIQERRGYQWLLINLALCSLTKKQRNKVEFQCREIITITMSIVLDHALNRDFHTGHDNMRLDQRQMKLH